MTGLKPKFGISHLTTNAKQALRLLANAYKRDVAVKVGTKTQADFEADSATVSRTVMRSLLRYGLAYYSPEGRYALLSTVGKESCDIPVTPVAQKFTDSTPRRERPLRQPRS